MLKRAHLGRKLFSIPTFWRPSLGVGGHPQPGVGHPQVRVAVPSFGMAGHPHVVSSIPRCERLSPGVNPPSPGAGGHPQVLASIPPGAQSPSPRFRGAAPCPSPTTRRAPRRSSYYAGSTHTATASPPSQACSQGAVGCRDRFSSGTSGPGAVSGCSARTPPSAQRRVFWPVKDANCSAVVWLASLSRLPRNGNVRASLPSLVWLV